MQATRKSNNKDGAAIPAEKRASRYFPVEAGFEDVAVKNGALPPILALYGQMKVDRYALQGISPLKMWTDVQDSIEALGQGDRGAYYLYLLRIRKGTARMIMGLPAWDSEERVASGAPSAGSGGQQAAHDVGAVGAAAAPSLNPQAAAFMLESQDNKGAVVASERATTFEERCRKNCIRISVPK
ncbi:hypothetical protein F4779DRAFT_141258 [Xylariaceae sp. FL0662B]|nr:hypothetical protein F4779DRAFT_141258 [Xylariaceae sp. FL0662B]